MTRWWDLLEKISAQVIILFLQIRIIHPLLCLLHFNTKSLLHPLSCKNNRTMVAITLFNRPWDPGAELCGIPSYNIFFLTQSSLILLSWNRSLLWEIPKDPGTFVWTLQLTHQWKKAGKVSQGSGNARCQWWWLGHRAVHSSSPGKKKMQL